MLFLLLEHFEVLGARGLFEFNFRVQILEKFYFPGSELLADLATVVVFELQLQLFADVRLRLRVLFYQLARLFVLVGHIGVEGQQQGGRTALRRVCERKEFSIMHLDKLTHHIQLLILVLLKHGLKGSLAS